MRRLRQSCPPPWRTRLSGFGAASGLWLLSALEEPLQVKMYAPPLAASAIILNLATTPPPLKNVLVGSCGAAILAVVAELGAAQLGVDSDVAARSLVVAVALVFFRTSGALFPPGATADSNAWAGCAVGPGPRVCLPSVLRADARLALVQARRSRRSTLTTRRCGRAALATCSSRASRATSCSMRAPLRWQRCGARCGRR